MFGVVKYLGAISRLVQCFLFTRNPNFQYVFPQKRAPTWDSSGTIIFVDSESRFGYFQPPLIFSQIVFETAKETLLGISGLVYPRYEWIKKKRIRFVQQFVVEILNL